MAKEKRSAAYLIRWDEPDDEADWRATVENANTGEKICFISKHDLLRFLWHSINTEERPMQIGADP